MKTKRQITEYRNKMPKWSQSKKDVDELSMKKNGSVRILGLDWDPKQEKEERIQYIKRICKTDNTKIAYELEHVMTAMDRYIKKINTPPMTYEEYLQKRQDEIDLAYWKIMLDAYDPHGIVPTDNWEAVKKLEKAYLKPKIRKAKLNQLKNNE